MKKYITLGVLGFILLVSLITVRVSTIKTGEVGVESRFGKVVGVRQAGLNFTFRPTTKLKNIKVTQDKFSETYEVSTKDMQNISVTTAVQYAVNPSMVIDLYSKFGTEYVDGIIAPKIAEAVNSTIAGYSITEVISERVEIANKINDSIKEELGSYGITIVSADIIDHEFSASYGEAVEKKMASEQKTLEAQEELKQAKIKAESNELFAKSYTKENYSYEFLKKWDGKLPQVLGSEDIMISLMDGSTSNDVLGD